MKLNKVVSKINILHKYFILVDYIIYDNILYLLYNYNSVIIYLITFDLKNYKIINKFKYINHISGCFNKNKIHEQNSSQEEACLYLLHKNLSISSINLKFIEKEYKIHTQIYESTSNLYNDKLLFNYTLYCINNKLYLCYIEDLSFVVCCYDDYIRTMIVIESNDCFSFHQANNNIYLNIFNMLYTFDTETKDFSVETYKNKYYVDDYIYKISKSSALVHDNLYDYKNDTTIILKKIPKYKYLATIDDNNIKDNLYIYDNSLLTLTYGTKSEINNDDDIILTNGYDKINFSKKVLIERSKFFKNMFDDVNGNNLEINFPLFDKLNIYLEYITTNNVDKINFNDLFELCLFIEDIDIKHLSNHIISRFYKNNLDEFLNYLQLFYTYSLMDEYYKLMSNLFHIKNFNRQNFINLLKQTKINSITFYIDTVDYLSIFKPYNYLYCH